MEPELLSAQRAYSHGGCRECKRRKIKCPEEKPQCSKCIRLHKICTYPAEGEKVQRVSNRISKPSKITQDADINGCLTLQFYKKSTRNITTRSHSDIALTQKTCLQDKQSLNSIPIALGPETNNVQSATPISRTPIFKPSISNILNEYETVLNTSASTCRQRESPKSSAFRSDELFEDNDIFSNFFNEYDEKDLNILAHDLNMIVSDMMVGSNIVTSSTKVVSEEGPFDISTQSASSFLGKSKEAHNNEDSVFRNIPLEYIKLNKSHEKFYLEEFYNDFANIILPFNSYDERSKEYFNPARDIILKCASNEAFMIAAVLAQGAKSCYKKNNLPEDEQAYFMYLSKCLKLLEPVLSRSRGNDTLSSNIESVLLTVLILTSSNASSTKQQWRPHLRGAKDLLFKLSAQKKNKSKIIIFCKYWFISIEILAGVSSNLGGTIKIDNDLDLLITPGNEYEIQVMRDLGLITSNGFNTMAGYHNDCIIHFRDLIKLLNKLRDNKLEYTFDDSMKSMRLLSEFYRQSEVQFIDNKGVFSENHYNSSSAGSTTQLEFVSNSKGNFYISWQDVSHQAYVLASIITIMTKTLGAKHDSRLIQNLTTKIISFISHLGGVLSILKPSSKFLLMVLQWPMLVAGINCIKEDHKFDLMKFFRVSLQIGSGSAGITLRRLQRIWDTRDTSTGYLEVEEDKGIDSVLY
ncbi:uncharacterized protein RJT20DRAFT_103149 [Scheffersomyces xylosifermentans]|uniref:uncharacterized protein n=1 Tax=Scheffersomyces xylosifermentans TaxID=1304137 RepID=UPI00315DED38